MAKLAQKAKQAVKEFSEQEFNKFLSYFEKFLNIVRGKVDVKYRLRLLLDPDNIKTSTRLTKGQIDFCSISSFIADYYPEFEPLKEYAKDHFALWVISQEGLGREEAIKYESAISESKLLQKMSLFGTQEATAKRKA